MGRQIDSSWWTQLAISNSSQCSTNGLTKAVVCVQARCSSMVRVFAHGAMGRQIDPPWGGPIKLFLDPASAP